MYHSEGKNVKVVGTIRFCSFFELLIVTFRQHFLVPPPPRVISVKGNYASSTRRALACFFSQTTNRLAGQFSIWRRQWKQVLWQYGGLRSSLPCYDSSTSILKFTTVPWIFFLLGKICCRAGSKETFLKVGTLSVKARAYPRQIKTNKMNFKNAAISLLQCYHGNIVIPIPFRALIFKHACSFCRFRAN